MASNGLTPLQEAFVSYYIGASRFIGADAARRAGYKGNRDTLAVVAYENLRKPQIAALIDQRRAEIRAEGIANRDARISAQQDRWDRMQRVILARAADMAAVPGGDTGLLVRQYKALGRGEDFQVVEEYAVDTGLLSEMRQLEQHTAKEKGEWVDKTAPTDPSGEHAYSDPNGDLTSRIAGIAAALRARHDTEFIDEGGGGPPPD